MASLSAGAFIYFSQSYPHTSLPAWLVAGCLYVTTFVIFILQICIMRSLFNTHSIVAFLGLLANVSLNLSCMCGVVWISKHFSVNSSGMLSIAPFCAVFLTTLLGGRLAGNLFQFDSFQFSSVHFSSFQFSSFQTE